MVNNFTVPCWGFTTSETAVAVSVIDGAVGLAETESGLTVGTGTMFIKALAEEACTLTITNDTDHIISVDGTAVEAGNNTTVSLTALTPQLVTIL